MRLNAPIGTHRFGISGRGSTTRDRSFDKREALSCAAARIYRRRFSFAETFVPVPLESSAPGRLLDFRSVAPFRVAPDDSRNEINSFRRIQ